MATSKLKKKNQPTFSVKVTDVYLKQNIVFHSLILYITSKFKNQEGKITKKNPEAYYFENAIFSHDWKLAFPSFSLQNNKSYCILMALH